VNVDVIGPFWCLFVCSVSLDLTCFLTHSVPDRMGPHCLFGGVCPILSLRDLRALVDGSIGRSAPDEDLDLPTFHSKVDVGVIPNLTDQET
jgi:hypothetical protein